MNIRLFSLLLSFAWLTADDKLVFMDNFNSFSDGAPISEMGWRLHDPGRDCQFSILNKELLIVCSTARELRGGSAEIDIPLCRRGMLEFDLFNDHDGKGIGLCIDFFNISIFWHEYCGDWRRYIPEPVSRRIPAFDIEPVGHRRLSAVTKKMWNHYRIVFDKDLDRVEYYLNDMSDPVFIDGGVAVWGRSEYQGGVLRLSNWGVVSDRFIYRMKNIRMTSLDIESSGERILRDKIILFNGLSSDRYLIRKAMIDNGIVADRIVEYSLNTQGSALEEKNKFIVDRMPGMKTTSRASAIVMVDFPRSPDAIIPDCVIDDVVENVSRGARLIILGGLLSYAKGGYANSSLAKVIPVQMSTCWDVLPVFPSLSIEENGSGFFADLDWQAGPKIAYRHALKPTLDSRVLLVAGDFPLLVSRLYGKGEVLAFLGTTCGTPSGVAFWRWSDWPKLATMMVMGKGR